MRKIENGISPLSRQEQRNVEALLEGPVYSGGENPRLGRCDDFGRFWVKHNGSSHCLWHPELLDLNSNERTLSCEGFRKTGVFSPLYRLFYHSRPLCLNNKESGVTRELDLASIRMVDEEKSGLMRVGKSGYVLADGDSEELDIILQRTNQSYAPGSFNERLFMQVLDENYQGADVMCLMFAPYSTEDRNRRMAIPGLIPLLGRMVNDGVAIDLQTQELIRTMIRRPLALSTWTAMRSALTALDSLGMS